MVLNHKVIASEQKDIYKFVEDIKIGTYGEYTMKKYYKKFFPNVQLEDKSGVSRYQSADIDLLLKDRKGIKSIEVKNDRTVFPNMFYEIVSVRKDGIDDTPGCLIVTEADYLVYLYQAIKVAVIVPVNNLNNWVVSHLSNPNNKPFAKSIVNNDGYEAEGYRIPVKTLVGQTYGIDAVQGIRLVDIENNKNISYQEYEFKRSDMYTELNRSFYTKINDKSDWEEHNKQLFPDKGKLNVNLLDKSYRLKLSKNKLRYLNALHSGREVLIKNSH